MSPYLTAALIAGIAAIALVALVVRAVTLVRRFRELAMEYRRQLATGSTLLGRRHAALLAELADRRGRGADGRPRTMR